MTDLHRVTRAWLWLPLRWAFFLLAVAIMLLIGLARFAGFVNDWHWRLLDRFGVVMDYLDLQVGDV